jgi:SAM-dependent methyltransferase
VSLRTFGSGGELPPGTGYYTAIMAHLVGPSGKVTGIELDPGLAERARDNLSSYPDVDVVCGNGAVVPFETADGMRIARGAGLPRRRICQTRPDPLLVYDKLSLAVRHDAAGKVEPSEHSGA